MRTPVILLLLCGLLAQPTEAAGARFGDWSADCDPAVQRCALETPAVNVEAEPNALLELERPLGRAVDRMVLTLPRPGISKQHSISLRIDGNDKVQVRPGETLDLLDGGRYRIEDPAILGRLLAQMRAGWRLRVEYFIGGRKPRSAFFSLAGLTAALGHPDATPPAAPAEEEEAAPTDPSATAEPKRTSVTPDLFPPPEDEIQAVTVDPDRLPAGSVFTPAGKVPPLGDCYDHQRATDDDGRFLGWISADRC